VNQTNKHGESGVHIAAGLGRLEMLRVLHGHGADLSAVDLQGDNAVYWAARQGHSSVIQFLVEQGVRVDTQNKVSILLLLCFVVLLSCFTYVLFAHSYSWVKLVSTLVVNTDTLMSSSI